MSAVRIFFKSMSPQTRLNWKRHYEDLIAKEEGTIQTKGDKMPWMLTNWRSGLEILTEVMNELNELNNEQLNQKS